MLLIDEVIARGVPWNRQIVDGGAGRIRVAVFTIGTSSAVWFLFMGHRLNVKYNDDSD